MNGQNRHFTLALTLGLLALVGMLTTVGTWGSRLPIAHVQASSRGSAQGGTTRHVSAVGGNDSGDCTTTPCRTVQYAVDRAASGDEIRITAGTYTGVQGRPAPPAYPPAPPPGSIITQVVYISKSLTIRGGYATANWTTPDPEANPTTLDAQGQGRVLFIGANVSPTIEGLRITGGDATGLSGHPLGPDVGGGVYVVRAGGIIRNNQVFSNTAAYGGGLSLYESTTSLSDNAFAANTADHGGGLHLYGSPATLSGNAIVNNTAGQGGGLRLEHGIPILNGNTFADNTATVGGGLHLYGGGAVLEGNTFATNMADHCGGLYLSTNYATLTNNIIVDNRTNIGCSGLCFINSSARLRHNTVAHNSGGDSSGVCVTAWPGFPGAVTLTNTILVSHTVGITVTAGNTATLEATLWGSGTWANGSDWGGAGAIVTGTVNVWDPPFFVDPTAGDYHIGPGSAALDAGVDAGVNTDVDREPRPYQAPDLGADEYWPPGALKRAYLPLVFRQSITP